jgi:hypothetical protein
MRIVEVMGYPTEESWKKGWEKWKRLGLKQSGRDSYSKNIRGNSSLRALLIEFP